MEQLTRGVPDDSAERAAAPVDAARWLMAQMLEWHRREDKASWWRYFDLLDMTDQELLEAREPLARIEPIREPGACAEAATAPGRSASPSRSTDSTPGTEVWDPLTRQGRPARPRARSCEVDDAAGTVQIYRTQAAGRHAAAGRARAQRDHSNRQPRD